MQQTRPDSAENNDNNNNDNDNDNDNNNNIPWLKIGVREARLVGLLGTVGHRFVMSSHMFPKHPETFRLHDIPQPKARPISQSLVVIATQQQQQQYQQQREQQQQQQQPQPQQEQQQQKQQQQQQQKQQQKQKQKQQQKQKPPGYCRLKKILTGVEKKQSPQKNKDRVRGRSSNSNSSGSNLKPVDNTGATMVLARTVTKSVVFDRTFLALPVSEVPVPAITAPTVPPSTTSLLTGSVPVTLLDDSVRGKILSTVPLLPIQGSATESLPANPLEEVALLFTDASQNYDLSPIPDIEPPSPKTAAILNAMVEEILGGLA